MRPWLTAVMCVAMTLPYTASAQQEPKAAPPPPPGHDISKVDSAIPGAVISIPLPESERKKLEKYDIPELAGARQALGSQLVNGELPRPLIDYLVRVGDIDQHLSIFEGGLVVLQMDGSGGSMFKKLILPDDGLAAYRKSISADKLATVRNEDVTRPPAGRRALIRVYRDDRTYAEVAFDPAGTLTKTLGDGIRPLQDLVRAMSEDRMVTNTVSGYDPKVGDELIGDDRKLWRVVRVIQDSGIVQLHCVGEPTVIYVQKKDLYNYFIGKPEGQ